MAKDIFSTKRSRILGCSALVIFLGGFGSWATLVDIPSGVQFAGQFTPQGLSQEVKSLRAGRIVEVNSQDGKYVKTGDVILTLETEQLVIQRNAVIAQISQMMATKARLEGEIAEREPRFEDIPEMYQNEAVIASEKLIYLTRKESLESQRSVLEARIASGERLTIELEESEESKRNQLLLEQKNFSTIDTLAKKKFTTNDRILSAERIMSEIEADISSINVSKLETRRQIEESKAQLRNLTTNLRAEASDQISQVSGELVRLLAQVKVLDQQIAEQTVLAPVDGVVIMPKKPRPGAVIGAGEPVARIVPEHEPLVLEGTIRPEDADNISIGMKASITPTGMKSRAAGDVFGRVSSISADSSKDERTGQYYFVVQVSVDKDGLLASYETEPFPGMPASANIISGSRTLWDYLSKPIKDSFKRAMRED